MTVNAYHNVDSESNLHFLSATEGSTCRRIRYRRFSQPGGLWANYLICATSGYLVYSSLACTDLGAPVGVGVLAACTLGLAVTKGGF